MKEGVTRLMDKMEEHNSLFPEISVANVQVSTWDLGFIVLAGLRLTTGIIPAKPAFFSE